MSGVNAALFSAFGSAVSHYDYEYIASGVWLKE